MKKKKINSALVFRVTSKAKLFSFNYNRNLYLNSNKNENFSICCKWCNFCIIGSYNKRERNLYFSEVEYKNLF